MNTPVSPPPPSSSGAQAATSVTAPKLPTDTPVATVEIAQPPLSFGAPAEGRLVEGMVVGKTAVDQFILETNSGSIAIRTTARVQVGTPITLQIVSTGTPILAAIIAPNPPGAPTASASARTPSPVKADASTAATSLSNSALRSNHATFVATVTGAPSTVYPSIAAQPTTTVIPNTTGAIPTGAKSATTPKAETSSPLPIGSRAPLRMLSAKPTGHTTSSDASKPSAEGNTPFNAVVTAAAGPGGLVTVQSPLGELTFPTNTPLPPGANLLLQIAGVVQTPAYEATSPQALAVASHWETLQTLLSASPPGASAHANVEHAIPKPNARLTASAMFFMSALRMGNLRQWLGADAMSVLEQSGLLGKMSEEFGIMRTLASETVGNDWRLFLIPLFSDAQLQNLKLYIHNNNGEAADEEDSSAQRFVIEVEFNRLGPFQFEGLSRPKRFDLIVRTARNIPDDMRDGIADVFTNTVTSLGLTGGISFKIKEPFLWQPMQSASPTGPDILI